jgi:hypothetical protein
MELPGSLFCHQCLRNELSTQPHSLSLRFSWILILPSTPESCQSFYLPQPQPMQAHYYLRVLLSQRQNWMMPSTNPHHMSCRHLRSDSLTQRALLVPAVALTRTHTHTLTRTHTRQPSAPDCKKFAERGLLRSAGGTYGAVSNARTGCCICSKKPQH